MKITDISPSFESRLERLKALEGKPALPVWGDHARDLRDRFSRDSGDISDMLQMLHESQRVIRVFEAGLETDRKFFDALAAAKIPLWYEYGAPPVDENLQHSLADKIYNPPRLQNPYACLVLGSQTKIVAPYLFSRLIKDGVPFDVDFSEPDFEALLLNHASDAGVGAMAAGYVSRYSRINTLVVAKSEDAHITPDKDKKILYNTGTAAVGARRKSGEVYYTLTYIPTVEDAEKDGMDYDSYVRLFFEMCDQPWERIKGAQEKMIEKFDAAKDIRITNEDGTDVTMSLVDTDGKPFTFCNSVIAKNVPGSEIFSAPRRDGVNGTIVAKGRFAPHHAPEKIIENLTLKIENGKIVSFSADAGAADFQAFLDRDPSNAYIGELGIGTNPHLGRHVINGLLVEKIGGSFHIALGDCYTYKTYEGKPVHLINGNATRTSDHWDMTTLLRGHGGKIYLDGEQVMDNGRWMDPALAVLNEGWAAVPAADRPDYWKNFTGYDASGNAQWNNGSNTLSQKMPSDPAQKRSP